MSCMNSVFYCNINSCVFYPQLQFYGFSWNGTMIPNHNHIDGSWNQVEITTKIYVILESVQESSQDSAWFWVMSTRIDSGRTLGSSMQDLSVSWKIIELTLFYVISM